MDAGGRRQGYQYLTHEDAGSAASVGLPIHEALEESKRKRRFLDPGVGQRVAAPDDPVGVAQRNERPVGLGTRAAVPDLAPQQLAGVRNARRGLRSGDPDGASIINLTGTSGVLFANDFESD